MWNIPFFGPCSFAIEVSRVENLTSDEDIILYAIFVVLGGRGRGGDLIHVRWIGYRCCVQLLKKSGWKEGTGLGASEQVWILTSSFLTFHCDVWGMSPTFHCLSSGFSHFFWGNCHFLYYWSEAWWPTHNQDQTLQWTELEFERSLHEYWLKYYSITLNHKPSPAWWCTSLVEWTIWLEIIILMGGTSSASRVYFLAVQLHEWKCVSSLHLERLR